MARVRVTLLLVCLLAASFAHAQASGPWYQRIDVQGLGSSYSGSTQRDALRNIGVFVRADYLERGGFTVGYNRTALSFDDASEDIDQDNLFLSGRRSLTPDWAPGRITLRLDGFAISNDDASNESDDVTVIAPQLSYLNYAQTFYWDIGFSTSSYGDSLAGSGALDVDQVTATLGFGLNAQRDWLQLRSYLIDPSNPQRAQNESNTAAVELKWTHWLTPRRPLGLQNVRLSALIGERIFAVDPDAGSVYNLSDLQTGGASLGGEWNVGERSRALLLVGYEQYENQAIEGDYRGPFVYLDFVHEW